MNESFTIQQIANAAGVTRYQVEAWISRGHFNPSNKVEKGKARAFNLDDAVLLATLAELNRLGLNPAIVSLHENQIKFRHGRGPLLVIKSVMRKVRTGSNAPEADEEIDVSAAEILNTDALISIIEDTRVRSFAVVNISEIEGRVKRSLENS